MPVIHTASNSNPFAACNVINETRSPPAAASASPTSASCSRKPSSGVSARPSSSSGDAAASAAAGSGRSPGGSSEASELPSDPGAARTARKYWARVWVSGLGTSGFGSGLAAGATSRTSGWGSSPAQARSNSRAAPTSSRRFSSRSSPSSPSRRSRSAYPVCSITRSMASAAPASCATPFRSSSINALNGATFARAFDGISGSLELSASQMERPSRFAEARRCSTVVSPMPRGGVLITRKRSPSERGFRQSRRYAAMSLTSARS